MSISNGTTGRWSSAAGTTPPKFWENPPSLITCALQQNHRRAHSSVFLRTIQRPHHRKVQDKQSYLKAK